MYVVFQTSLILAGKSVLKRKREHFSIYKTCSDRNFCHLQLINVQSVKKKKKNANYASNNGMYIKRDKLWIKRMVLDLHDVIVDSRKVVLSEYEMSLLP